MYVIVLVLGILAIAIGGLSTAYGITIRDFSFGNSLLIIGATAFVGGLVLIGIAGAIRELHRIVEALSGRQAPRYLRPGEPHEPLVPGNIRSGMVPGRMPAPPMPPMPPPMPARSSRDIPAPAPRLETVAPVEAAPVAEQPAPIPAPAASVEPAATASEPLTTASEPRVDVVSEPEQLSLLPSEAPPVAPNAAIEPTPAVDELDSIPLSPRVPDDVTEAETRPRDDEAIRAEPWTPPAAERASTFDAIWPKRERSPGREAAYSAPSSELPPSDDLPSDNDDATNPPEIPAPSLASSELAVDQHEQPHPVSILKSGVVDGMAYTLYSDGSIEAELATGTIRFGSIHELRMHLERTA